MIKNWFDVQIFGDKCPIAGPDWIKLIYSEKATKFYEIFPLLLTGTRKKVRVRFRKILWHCQNI